MSRFIGVFVMLALASAQTQAPQAFQQQNPDNVIRITVNLVQVDAVVTDSHDKPVTNLKKEDFVLLQDGKPQTINYFTYVNTGTRDTSVRPTTTSAPKQSGPGQKGAAPPPPPPPPRGLKPSQIRRTVALVVDDLGLSFESIARIRGSLKKFVDQEMQPGDLVAIMRTGAGMGALQQFTSDKRLLYAAIDKIKYNAFGRVGVSSFTPLQAVHEGAPDTTNADNEREQIFSAGTMGAVQYIVEGLKELPGRKSVILFSENMKINYADGQSQRVMDSIKRLTDAANRASVVIYTIDPRGLQYTGLTAADDTSGRSPQQLANISMERSQQIWDSQDGLVQLAHQTGGLFLHDNNDIGNMLKKAVDDGAGYYLLGYHPDASTFDAKTGQPKFHNLSVRVKVPGLHVRYRSGFFGQSDRPVAPIPQDRIAQLRHALFSPFGGGALHVRLTSIFSQTAQKGPYLTSLFHFDPKELQFSDEPDDWHKAVIDVVAMTFGDSGQPVDVTDKTWTVRLKGDTYQRVLKDGLVYRMNVPVKKPGAYQMRIALRDTANGQVGSATQFVDVPDVKKGHLALSGIMLSADNSKIAAQAAAAAQANATTGAAAGNQSSGQGNTGDQGEEGHVNDPDPNSTPAVRIFKPGTPIVYGYQILNAQADGAKKPELEVQTRLFRDGQEVYKGTPKAMEMGAADDPKRLVGGGRMQLGDKITPGDYVLQVIVTDKLAKEKYRMATQSMDFEVRP
jgi:VWFA-related protein